MTSINIKDLVIRDEKIGRIHILHWLRKLSGHKSTMLFDVYIFNNKRDENLEEEIS